MRKSLVPFGLACLSLCASGAEAKLVRYEINGQQYSYSTNNRQQSREARQRIDAARTAEAAKARADAEAASNPLARLFGSAAQREAAEAQARVQQVLGNAQAAAAVPAAPSAGVQPEVTATSSVRPGRESSRASQRARVRREAARGERQASLSRPGRLELDREPSREISTPIPRKVEPSTPAPPPTPRQVETPAPQPARPVASAPALESQAPARTAPIPSVGDNPRPTAGGSLTDFVNQVRQAPADAPPRLR